MYVEIEELPHLHKWSLTIGETGSISFRFMLDAIDVEYLSKLLKEMGF